MTIVFVLVFAFIGHRPFEMARTFPSQGACVSAGHTLSERTHGGVIWHCLPTLEQEI